jgi:hypothetical protein
VRTKAGVVAVLAALAAFAAPSASASNPTAVGAASPSTVAPGRSTLLTVAVTPGEAPPSTGLFVSCNLSSIGGAFNQMLVDDGTSGDATAGDLAFSYRATVSATAALGPRTLACVVSDAQGRSTLPQISLLVDAVPNEPPTAGAGGPYQVDEGSSVTLTAAGSDPEGGPLSYAWDLNSDGVFETPGQSVSLAPDDGPALRAVAVRVMDDSGLTADASALLNVRNVAPGATFHAPTSAAGSFRLSLTAPHDPSVADAAGFDYAFDCGRGYGGYGDAAATTCAAAAGSLAVGARIRDKDGAVTEYRATVDASTSFAGLCELTRSLSRKPHVAEALCRKLAKAERARTARKRRHYLREYRRGVRAQTGRKRSKAFSLPDGARLQSLARELEG